jgi:hypothetical protein
VTYGWTTSLQQNWLIPTKLWNLSRATINNTMAYHIWTVKSRMCTPPRQDSVPQEIAELCMYKEMPLSSSIVILLSVQTCEQWLTPSRLALFINWLPDSTNPFLS